MTTKKFMGVFLSVAMAVPSGATTATTGTVRGMVSVAGRGLADLPLTLVNVETGKSFAIRSAADGSFTATLPAGSYVFSSPGRSGVAISRAPLSVEVFSGKVASANVEVAAFGLQDAMAAAGTATINHDPVDCITEGEFTLIEATFEPLSSLVNGRLYFQSNLSPEWFYTEFEKIDPPVPGGWTHRAFIPKVNKDGGIETITYFLQGTSTDFAETKSPEKTAKVVAGATDCDGKLAPIGNPQGAISVLSASGGSAGAVAGFGGVAGAGIGALAVAGIVVGVVAGGAVVREATKSTPTPSPTAPPVGPTPPPSTPTPTPVQTCSLAVFTSPVAPADPFFGGRFCTATVVSNGQNLGVVEGVGRFTGLPCTASISVFANVAPQSSILSTLPATWSGACGGSALGVPCIINPLVTDRNVALECQTR